VSIHGFLSHGPPKREKVRPVASGSDRRSEQREIDYARSITTLPRSVCAKLTTGAGRTLQRAIPPARHKGARVPSRGAHFTLCSRLRTYRLRISRTEISRRSLSSQRHRPTHRKPWDSVSRPRAASGG